MQIVHRATSFADAQIMRDVLVGSGISTHIADAELWDRGVLTESEGIRVMVDNRSVDRARRAVAAWKKQQAARRNDEG